MVYNKVSLDYESKSENFSPEDFNVNDSNIDCESKRENFKFEDEKKNAKLEFDNFPHS